MLISTDKSLFKINLFKQLSEMEKKVTSSSRPFVQMVNCPPYMGVDLFKLLLDFGG